MKKIVLISILLFSSSLFSQDLSFVKNKSLLKKVNNIIKFINESSTIRTNYANDKIYIYSDGNVSMTVVIVTNVSRIYEENRCFKINERITWIIDDINDVDDKYIDKEKLNKLSDCSCVVKKEKSKEMLNSVFNFYQDIDGDYYLESLVTFDKRLYLEIEYREDLSDDD